MAGEIITTIVGNLTDDPELRFTPNGAPVAQFSVAVNPKSFDRQTGEWVDRDPSFVRVSAWQSLAENTAESLHRGDRVIVQGTFAEDRWQDDQGNNRSAWKLTATSVGPDLRFASATPRKIRRGETAPDDPFATASTERPGDQAGDQAEQPAES